MKTALDKAPASAFPVATRLEDFECDSVKTPRRQVWLQGASILEATHFYKKRSAQSPTLVS